MKRWDRAGGDFGTAGDSLERRHMSGARATASQEHDIVERHALDLSEPAALQHRWAKRRRASTRQFSGFSFCRCLQHLRSMPATATRRPHTARAAAKPSGFAGAGAADAPALRTLQSRSIGPMATPREVTKSSLDSATGPNFWRLRRGASRRRGPFGAVGGEELILSHDRSYCFTLSDFDPDGLAKWVARLGS